MGIKLYELRGKDPKYLWSSNPWKARMCLKLKGIEFESAPLTYPEIHAILPGILHKEKGCTVPVLVDGENVIQDSFKIAQYLEEKYTGASIFQGNLALHEFIYNWIAEIKEPLFKLVILDIANKLDDESKEYYIKKNTALYGDLRIAALKDREVNVKQIQRNLNLLLGNLQRSTFLSGETIGWTDITLASFLYMIKLANERVLNEVIASTDQELFKGWWNNMSKLME